MNNRPECLPCCLRRILHTAERATTDEWLHRKILAEAMQALSRVDDKATPAEVIHVVARKTGKTLGVADPYLEEKRRWIEETTGNAAWIRSVVASSPDPFLAALRLSIAANVLDCELRQDFVKGLNLKSLMEGSDAIPFATENVEDFRQAVRGAGKVLFIHDSAGEIFFDRLLIEEVRKLRQPPMDIVSAVRSVPILADATREDALAVALEEVATVIDLGIDCLGVPLSACSEEFRECYRAADVIVAKGQASFETLEGKDSRIDGLEKQVFFLLRVKCALLARYLGASVGDIVLERT
ncbi:MAG TPA: ARMT1-like domain-containing protein [Planctomycetota bacterium]|nr:ARMT1-like domain-containing protein [Planctomycetota bacterium]